MNQSNRIIAQKTTPIKNELVCKNIFKTYKLLNKKYEILKNINFEISKGEICVILGPSGSGKTTLLNILAGIDKATQGNCFIKNVDINNVKDKILVDIRKKYISYIYQKYGLIPILSAMDNILLAQHLVPKHKRIIDLKDIVQIIGIEKILNKFPHELSGGQKQRIAIARAIIKQPELMLCDEPTGALDSETSSKIIDLFLKINYLFKTTIIIVTHDLSISKIASKVIHIYNGQVSKIIHQDNSPIINQAINSSDFVKNWLNRKIIHHQKSRFSLGD